MSDSKASVRQKAGNVRSIADPAVIKARTADLGQGGMGGEGQGEGQGASRSGQGE